MVTMYQGEPETADEISLGRMYEYGERVPQDYATAIHWYQLAAVARDTCAQAGVERVEEALAKKGGVRFPDSEANQ